MYKSNPSRRTNAGAQGAQDLVQTGPPVKAFGGITLDFELVYTDCNLADEHVESKPVLRTYFDSHFDRTDENGGIITTHLDEHDLTKIYEGRIHGQLFSLSNPVPVTAKIGFVQYAMRRNEFGFASMTHAGTAEVSLHQIMLSLEKGIKFETEQPLVMHPSRIFTDDPIVKGKIKFRVKKMEIAKECKFIPIEKCVLCEDNLNDTGNAISSFIDERIRFESSMKDTWPGIKNVRAPMDISSASIQSTKNIFLPIESLVLPQPLQVNVEYYQNAFETVMKRKFLTTNDYKELDLAHKAEVMMEICCYAAQSFDYISDTVETSTRKQSGYDQRTRRPWEDMGNSAEICGDCEDGSNCVDTFFQNLRKLAIDPVKNPQLFEMQKIAYDYTYMNTLATVHGAKADDNTEHIGAHMYGLAIPNMEMKRMLETNAQGAALAEKMDLTQKNHDLPTLVAEGTGMVRPLGSSKFDYYPKNVREMLAHHVNNGEISSPTAAPGTQLSFDPIFEERKYVSRNLQKGGLKSLIPRDQGAESSFYLGQLLGVTSQHLDQTKVGAYIFANIGTNGEVTRGAYFTDILNQKSNVSLIPCTPMPERMLQIVYESVTLRAPLRSFVLDKKKPIEGSIQPPEFEKMKKAINSLGRKGQAPFGSVDFYVKSHQYTAKSLAAMTENLIQMKAVFKLDYEREIYTNSEIGYRVKLYIDRNKI